MGLGFLYSNTEMEKEERGRCGDADMTIEEWSSSGVEGLRRGEPKQRGSMTMVGRERRWPVGLQ